MYHVRTQHEDQELWARYDKVAMLHTWSKKADIAHQKDIHLKQLKKTGGERTRVHQTCQYHNQTQEDIAIRWSLCALQLPVPRCAADRA